MRILLFDALFPRGHKVQNNSFIRLLDKMGVDLYICAEHGWFELNNNVHLIKKSWVRPGENSSNAFIYRMKILQNFKMLESAIKETNPDIVFIVSYDILSLAVFFPRLIKFRKKFLLLEHNNVDQLNNKIKRIAYALFKNFFHHLVFEDFIRKRLIELGVKANLISIIPHLYNQKINLPSVDKNDESIDHFHCVALSSSNDDSLISKIIEYENQKQILRKNNIRVFIKSKTLDYDDGYLVVKRGYIPSEQYDSLIRKCKVSYAPFESVYQYRMSGWIVDSFSAHKCVVATSFKLAVEYEKLYPGLIYVCDEPVAALDLICDLCKSNEKKQFDKFEYDHSEHLILKAFQQVMK